MIIPFSASEQVLLAERFGEKLPRQLLRNIATSQMSGTPASLLNLAGQVRRWLPDICSEQAAPATLRTMLAWFHRHGDIERGKGGTFTCPPSYIIGHLGDIQTSRKALLLGNPLRDALLETQLAAKKVSYTARTVIHNEQLEGWERGLIIPSGVAVAGVKVDAQWIDLAVLRERIPPLRYVLLPPPQPELLIPTWGIWERYIAGDEWHLAQPSTLTHTELWRWRSNEEQHPEQGRYFIAVEGAREEQWRELSGEQAATLWMLWLDRESTTPRKCFHDTGALYVPRALPISVERWLMWEHRLAGIAAPPSKQTWSNRYWRYLLSSNVAATEAANFLQQRLGLQIEQGVPY